MALLDVADLSVAYGAVRAVRNVTLAVDEGELVALLGANGAGKSTTLKSVMGLIPPSGGRITFAGRDITRGRTEDIVRAGMTLVPEGRRVFYNLTVDENLRLGAVGSGSRAPESLDRLYELFPILRDRRAQLAGTLSGGEQQQLAISRALRSSPRLLLLDEPSLGLAPRIVEAIFELLASLRAAGVTICLVEQNVHQALEVADRAYVLATGELRLSGTGADLLASSEIEQAYLGIGAA